MSAGTQSIEKALALWRDVAQTLDDGARLSDLAAKRGLNPPTARRTLLALVRTGWLEQDSASRRYRLGIRSITLGAVSSRFSRLQQMAQSSLLRLSAACDDAVFLCIPLADGWVCVQRLDGSHPVRTHSPQTADRHPLGQGSAGLVFLDAQTTPPVNFSVQVSAQLALVRAQGFAFDPGLVFADCWDIATCVCDEQGLPVAALGISAIASRLKADRRSQLVSHLQHEARVLSEQVAQDAQRQRRWMQRMAKKASTQATAQSAP